LRMFILKINSQAWLSQYLPMDFSGRFTPRDLPPKNQGVIWQVLSELFSVRMTSVLLHVE
ncbi:MAG TPA: hypothetical protein PK583_02185, partial [Gammaproteobacteria bacterium]|nr:hypothetical protein [Gammaproteobacteria bacterium]